MALSIFGDNTVTNSPVVSSLNAVDASNTSDLRFVFKVTDRYASQHEWDMPKYTELLTSVTRTYEGVSDFNKIVYSDLEWDTLSNNLQLNVTTLVESESTPRPIVPQNYLGQKVIMYCIIEVRLHGAQPLINQLQVSELLKMKQREKALKSLTNAVNWVQARLMNLKQSFLSGEEVDFDHPLDDNELISTDED